MWLLPLAFVLAVSLAGCGQKPAEEPPPASTTPAPFRVSGVLLGKSVRPDMSVEAAATTFGTRDTIYASVATEGVSSGVTLKARWMYEDGTQVNESAQTIAPAGPSVTEFHVSMENPWPKGKYMVEIWADTTAVDTLEYQVK
jgi:hypothetical protein